MLCQMVPQRSTAHGTVFKCRCCQRVTPATKSKRVVRECTCDANDPRLAANTVELPSISRQALTYASGVTEWVKAGRPERSDEEVKRIFETCCAACPWLTESGQCGQCGCPVLPPERETGLRIAMMGKGLSNKIRMATEDCPDRCQACGHSRWQHGAGVCQCGCPQFVSASGKKKVAG